MRKNGRRRAAFVMAKSTVHAFLRFLRASARFGRANVSGIVGILYTSVAIGTLDFVEADPQACRWINVLWPILARLDKVQIGQPDQLLHAPTPFT